MLNEIARALKHLPETLVNYRPLRYGGDTVCCRMDELPPRDQETINQLYKLLCRIFENLAPPTQKESPAAPIKKVLSELCFYRIIDSIRQLSCDTGSALPGSHVSTSIHDIRSGALSALVGILDGVTSLQDGAPVPSALFSLTRDHLKIMRNSLQDLDLGRREVDLLPRAHSLELIVHKWRNYTKKQEGNRQVKVEVECSLKSGTFSESCLESAAVDRIMYNFVNNAAQHCIGERIRLSIEQVPPGDAPMAYRFLFSNNVSLEGERHLQSLASPEGRLDELFEKEVSTTGSGLGLAIAAEFVANAFGLGTGKVAVSSKYVGALVTNGVFVGWFHWPWSTMKPHTVSEEELLQKIETV